MDLWKCRFTLPIIFYLLLSLVLQASAGCSNLEVFNGNEKVVEIICKEEYSIRDCRNFTEAFDSSLLPGGQEMVGDTVQRPADLTVLPEMWTHPLSGNKTGHYPALHLIWTSPSSGNARKSITGFFLWMQSDDKVQTECRILTIDQSSQYKNQLEFRYDIPKISESSGRNYSVKIYSMPLPADPDSFNDWMNDRENYKGGLVTTKNPFEMARGKEQFPADWSPGISANPSIEDKSINVSFELPDPKLNFDFTNYSVKLVNMNYNTVNSFKKIDVNIPLSSNKTIGQAVFTNLPLDGIYQVYVQVIDPFWDDDKRCLCHRIVDTFIGPDKDCANVCGISRTAVFNMLGNVGTTGYLGTEPRTFVDATTTTSSVETGEVRSRGTDDSDQNIIWIVISVITCLTIIGIVVFLVLRKMHHSAEKNMLPFTKFEPSTKIHNASSKVFQIQPNPRYLSRKTVYLLSSSDHEYHQVMVKKFVAFLQNHCLCDVMEPSALEANQHQGGRASWLANKLSRCDYIIFFDSIGAYRRLEAFCQEKLYKPTETGPDGDLFNLGLLHLYREDISNKFGNQVIAVTLTEVLSKSKLFVSTEYVLPKHLISFLQKLHNFGSDSVGVYKSQLPLMTDCHSNLDEMVALCKAINEVKNFEQEYPEWFSSHYELENPVKTDCVTSLTDSDYSSVHGGIGRSVTPEIEDSSNFSPVSDFSDVPDFQFDDYIPKCTRPEPSCVTIPTHPNAFATQENDGSTACEKSDVYDTRTTYLIPPVDDSQLNVEQFSLAMRNLNQNTKFGKKNEGTNAEDHSDYVINPPRQQLAIDPSDSVSQLIRGMNSNGMQKNNSLSTNLKEKGINHSDETVLKTNNSSAEHNGETVIKDKAIIPPRDLVDGEQAESFSCILKNMNAQSKSSDLTMHVIAPRDEAPVPEDENISNILRNMNHQSKNSSQTAHIIPPRDESQVPEDENVSNILRNMNDQSKNSNQTAHVVPPRDEALVPEDESISNILRNMNSMPKSVSIEMGGKENGRIHDVPNTIAFQDSISYHV